MKQVARSRAKRSSRTQSIGEEIRNVEREQSTKLRRLIRMQSATLRGQSPPSTR